MPTNVSWPNFLWALTKLLGMWVGILFVAGGAMFYTLRFIYGIPISNPILPQLIVLGFLILACCTYGYRSWIGKLTGFRNLVIYSLGMIFPFLLGASLLRLFLSGKTHIQMQDVVLLIACATVFYIAYSFLKARNALLTKRVGRKSP